MNELALKAKEGDEGAFEKLCARMLPKLMLWKYKDPTHLNTLDDINQLGCIAIWECVQKFNGKGRFEGYTALKGRQLVLDMLGAPHKRLLKHQAKYVSTEKFEFPVSPVMDPELLVKKRRLERMIDNRRCRIKKNRVRQVYDYFCEHPGAIYKEAGEEIGIDECTVFTNVARLKDFARKANAQIDKKAYQILRAA